MLGEHGTLSYAQARRRWYTRHTRGYSVGLRCLVKFPKLRFCKLQNASRIPLKGHVSSCDNSRMHRAALTVIQAPQDSTARPSCNSSGRALPPSLSPSTRLSTPPTAVLSFGCVLPCVGSLAHTRWCGHASLLPDLLLCSGDTCCLLCVFVLHQVKDDCHILVCTGERHGAPPVRRPGL